MISFKQYLTEKLSSEELAKKLEVSIDDVNSLKPGELATILKWIGNHDFVPDSKFDAKELAKGIEVEHEHTDSKIAAKLVAKDHLTELPDYYSRLEKMEKTENKR